MAVLDAAFLRITNSDGRPVAGTLTIYNEDTTDFADVFTDKAQTNPLTNPVEADAAGMLPPVYLAAGTYALILKDADGATLGTNGENLHYVVPDLTGLDTINFPVVPKSADFTITAADTGTVFEVDASGGLVTVTMDSATNGNGVMGFVVKKDSSANNVVLSAGGGQTFNGGNSTYNLTQQNQAAGFASQGAAGWRIFMLPAPTATPIKPQGRLTLTTGVPVLAADVTAATTLYYTAFEGNYVPLWDGSTWSARQFAADLSLALDSNSGHTNYHAAKKLYDVFVTDDGGTTRFGTGPGWDAGAGAGAVGNYVSGGTLTTSSAARGTGAGSTAITRTTTGIYTNTNSLVLRFGSASGNTVTIAAGKATYLGTIWIDATDGQLSCHVAYGQNRKWGVWNAYNRRKVKLLAGDTTATWSYATATTRASNNTVANALTVLCGLAEEWIESVFSQLFTQTTNSGGVAKLGIGFNASTAISGVAGQFAIGNVNGHTLVARFNAPPALGLNAFIGTETGAGAGAAGTWTGTNASMELSAAWEA